MNKNSIFFASFLGLEKKGQFEYSQILFVVGVEMWSTILPYSQHVCLKIKSIICVEFGDANGDWNFNI